jgi:thiamine-phosphate pyrophosphorylase
LLSGTERRILCYATDRAAIPAVAGISEPEPEQIARLGAKIRAAIAAGVDWVQIREKDLSGRQLAELTRATVAAAVGRRTRVIVNDRLDVALAAGAGGVHLGRESLPVREVVSWREKEKAARTTMADFLIGASCHSLAEARAAADDGADYIIFGPVFETPSKMQFGAPLGIERLREVCGEIRIRVLAIGGITEANAAECFRAGARGIAAIRLFQGTNDAEEMIRRVAQLQR